eukprot:scaffold84400_cov41-Prasinocladus_malaysianus.AAC.1
MDGAPVRGEIIPIRSDTLCPASLNHTLRFGNSWDPYQNCIRPTTHVIFFPQLDRCSQCP